MGKMLHTGARRHASSLVMVSLGLVAFAALGALAACARRDQSAVEQQGDADAQRRLYLGLAHPLISGDERLLDSLIPAAARPVTFVLTQAGETALDRPVSGDDASREDLALFMVTSTAGDRSATWILDPRTMRLELVADGICSIFRAVPAGGSITGGPIPLDIYRFEFSVAGGVVTRGSQVRLTRDGGNSLPVETHGGTRVAYLHRLAGEHGESAHTRLMQVDRDGDHDGDHHDGDNHSGGPRELLPAVRGGIADLRRSGNQLVFASDQDGPWRLFHCDQDGGAVAAWDGESLEPFVQSPVQQPVQQPVQKQIPQEEPKPAVTLAFSLVNGQLRPQVLEIPHRLGLRQVAALVEARNPAVVRRRALLAAALIEAQELDLANLPTLNLSLLYNPAVGVLTDPVGFSGDYLSGGVVRALLGISQPLLDWNRNHALSAAGAVRAEIARDVLAEEINRQQAEAAATLIACQAITERLDQDRQLLALAEHALVAVAKQATRGTSGKMQELAADQELFLRRGERASDQAWQRVLTDRLKGLCGLDAACTSQPAEAIMWDDVPLDDYPTLIRLAMLNHPRMRAAHGALREAFFISQTGSRYRPSLDANAGYVVDLRHGSDPVDDFVTLGLNGSLPLGYFKDRDLDHEHHVRLAEALRAGEEEAALEIRRELADHWALYRQWHGVLRSERAHLLTATEAQRVADLRAVHGQPGIAGAITVSSLAAGERDTVLAARAVTEAWREVAVRRIRIAEAEGLADSVWRTAGLPAATWLWQRDILSDGLADGLADNSDSALAAARTAHLDRIYLYVGPDGVALSGAEGDRIETFLVRAAHAGVAVWALLGEPDWLDGDAERETALTALTTFQNRVALPFQGLKLDIEPHARPAWGDPAGRSRLLTRYVGMLTSTRQRWHAPLWVDCPAQFFRAEQRDLLAQITPLVDGVTAMCYSDDGQTIENLACEAVDAWPKPLEIGIDLSPTSPHGESLAGMSRDRIDELRRHLDATYALTTRVRGVAFHDLDALLPAQVLGNESPADPAPRDLPAAPSSKDQP